ncbi:MAG: pyruvate phosphate dikinase [Candidatus Cloacimonetes bacterium]|nr:pyruvate phosphate dikinase [Candidatus Cloacimonadota bacterium]
METLDSKALADNLAATKVADIILDKDALFLLSLSDEYYGIQERCKRFLEELYHPYVNPDTVILMMRQCVLGDLWLYVQVPESTNAIKVIIKLFKKLDTVCKKPNQEKLLIQLFLEFVSALSDHRNLTINVLDNIKIILQDWIKHKKDVFIRLSGLCRKSLNRLITFQTEEDIFFQIVKNLLKESLKYWEKNTDIESLYKRIGSSNNVSIVELNNAIGKDYYQNWLRKLRYRKDMSSLSDIPAFNDIAAQHRDFLREFTHLTERIHYIFYLLSLPGMVDLRDHLLWDLNRQLADLNKELSPEEILSMLDSLFKAFNDLRQSHLTIVLDCLHTIGKTVLSGEDQELKNTLLRKIIDLGFTPPGDIHITDDWQIEVDKNHIKHLRVYLELIAIDPLQCKNLLAHMIISLTRQGVFISDTDLFQKDVSSFLNSDIKPLFVQIKHLLRLFPVFFNEIGAEGEIRDISTEIDEIGHRNDRLIHFLRKQLHSESNNTHILLIEKILAYWIDLNPKHLNKIIPEDVKNYIQRPDENTRKQSKIVNHFLQDKGFSAEELLSLSWQKVQGLFEDRNDDFFLKRLKLLCYCHFLLKDKYNLDPHDVIKFLSHYSFFTAKEQNRLRHCLVRKDYESSIRLMLNYIERLNITILDSKQSTGWENIYYKRHIAAGIPSMYGVYKEPKLDAMGMVFRLENVIRRLFERNIAQLNIHYINGKTLRRIIRILDLYDYAMKQEMVTNDAFSSALAMLRSVVNITNLSLDQYLDIFRLLKDSINEIINEYYYRFYDSEIKKISQLYKSKEASEIFAEEFYRNLFSTSFLVQGLDNFIASILDSLEEMKYLFASNDISRVMSYDPDKLFFHLYTKNSRIENQVLLGSKAYFLKRMYQYEFPIPPGFVITTDLYRYRDIINTHPNISNEFDDLLWQNIKRLEQYTGLRLGDPERPLILSVRSGAPLSLPGAMDTFLNIGLTDEITLKLSQRPNYGWTAWDCYRRLIQSWGMAHGIDRDDFDAVMIRFKKLYQVELKTEFTDDQMRLMVDEYKAVLAENDIYLEQEPFMQVYKAISHVLDSWNTERAKLYRQKLHIADEWGTAVIIQKMVLGNISLDSGTGVLFTYADWNPQLGICLNGDFKLCSQGEDVVAGLVHTLPISESQRQQGQHSTEISLEKDFSELYHALLSYAKKLIEDRNYPHQEIEFTFERPNKEKLYILQTRNQVIHKTPDYNVLALDNSKRKLIGTGIGIGKGAVNGIIVITKEDIERFANKDSALILVRPDTVPDDMDMLFECQGLLTSRGGVTSHAAVTATRLGLIGVVNCRELVVNEEVATCRIGNFSLVAGDKIALDATSGSIYLGHYPLKSVNALR